MRDTTRLMIDLNITNAQSFTLDAQKASARKVEEMVANPRGDYWYAFRLATAAEEARFWEEAAQLLHQSSNLSAAIGGIVGMRIYNHEDHSDAKKAIIKILTDGV